MWEATSSNLLRRSTKNHFLENGVQSVNLNGKMVLIRNNRVFVENADA